MKTYIAIHPPFEKCGTEVPLCPDYLTYLAPSGLAISLPKRACQREFTGMLKRSDDKIYISKNILTSFSLDNDFYYAESDGEKFLGYYRFGLDSNKDRDRYYEDTYTIKNLDNLSVLLQKSDCFSGDKMEFKELTSFKEKYYAKGELVKVCKYCQKSDCGGECRLLCSKCLQPKLKGCYCGQACICFAERFLENPLGGCDHKRYMGVGIPTWDSQGKLVIKNYLKGSDEQTKLYNLILDSDGIRQFYLKLGQNPPASPQDIVGNIATFTGYYEKIADGKTKTTLGHFNQLYSIYSSGTAINDAMNNEEFMKAFYEAVKCIPAVGEIMGSIESLFSVIYSETFNRALLNRVNKDLDALGNDNSRLQNELSTFKGILEKNIDRVKRQQIEDIHNQICTCPK